MHDRLTADGFAIIHGVATESAIAELLAALADVPMARSRAGIRHAQTHPAVRKIANSPSMLAIAEEVLGPGPTPFRATLFDKSPRSNWHVVWHQDTALPMSERHEVVGFGPWSQKAGTWYAHAPARALEPILALRLHIDDSTQTNGPLRVLPGTHSLGVLTDPEIDRLVAAGQPVACTVLRCGVVAMRPLILHASSKATAPDPRRVLHLEYAPAGYQPAKELLLARV
jgi:ectoine hydroxylase-related dioxygenase (phytanoyl-CoA dioxygenase family)